MEGEFRDHTSALQILRTTPVPVLRLQRRKNPLYWPFPDKALCCRMEADIADRAGLLLAHCWLALQLLCLLSLPWGSSSRATLQGLRYESFPAHSVLLEHVNFASSVAMMGTEQKNSLPGLKWTDTGACAGHILEYTHTAGRPWTWHKASSGRCYKHIAANKHSLQGACGPGCSCSRAG